MKYVLRSTANLESGWLTIVGASGRSCEYWHRDAFGHFSTIQSRSAPATVKTSSLVPCNSVPHLRKTRESSSHWRKQPYSSILEVQGTGSGSLMSCGRDVSDRVERCSFLRLCRAEFAFPEICTFIVPFARSLLARILLADRRTGKRVE